MIPSSNTDPIYKIIMLGNSGVGKTALVTRWIKDEFSDDSRPTIGASNFMKEIQINSQKVKITLWDTAGQEQFRAITPLYVRGAKVGIVVTSQIDADSFKSIDQWLDLLTSQDKQIPAILAVSKADLETAEPLEELIAPVKERFESVFFVSAKTGDGVDTLFREAALSAVNHSPQESQNDYLYIGESQKEKKSCC